jgi:hypothetical protein
LEIGVNVPLIAMAIDLGMEIGAYLPLIIAVVTEVVEDEYPSTGLVPCRWRMS